MTRSCVILGSALLLGGATARAGEPVPPMVATVATTTLDAAGRPWAYLVFDPNRPGLLDGRTFGVYVKPGTPDAAAAFTFRGVVGATTDPSAINVMLSRAASLGDNIGALEAQVIGLHRFAHQQLRQQHDHDARPAPDAAQPTACRGAQSRGW